MEVADIVDAQDQERNGRGVQYGAPTSKRCLVPSAGARNRSERLSDKSPKGILMAKSQCQEAIAKMPEATLGPAAADVNTTIPPSPIPRPSRSRGYVYRIAAADVLQMHAAPTPWKVRARISVFNECGKEQPNEASVNSAKPIW